MLQILYRSILFRQPWCSGYRLGKTVKDLGFKSHQNDADHSFTFTCPLTARIVGPLQVHDFTTTSLHFSLFSTALWDLANSRPVHSLVMSSHLFFCLHRLLPSFIIPCKTVLARPNERQTYPCQCSLRLFTMVRKSLRDPIACWI